MHLITGSDDQTVRLFTLHEQDGKPKLKMEKVIYRTTLSVRHVAVLPPASAAVKTQWVAIASDDIDITLVDLNDLHHILTLKGHSRSVKSLAFDPKGEFLVSSSSDGTVRVWDMKNDEGRCVKTLEGLILQSEPESGEVCRIAWHKSGSQFAIPGRSQDVVVIQRGTWKKRSFWKDDDGMDITTLQWSPNGDYLAATDINGHFSIWKNGKTGTVISQQHKTRITSLAWHPKENDFCLTDVLGRIVYWKDIIPTSDALPHPAKKSQAENPIPSLFDNEDGNVSERNKSSRGRSEREDEEGPGEDLEDEDEHLEFVEDDDGAGYADRIEGLGGWRDYQRKSRRRVVERMGEELSMGTGIHDAYDEGDIQDPFQPGATPAKNGRRYLAFNMHGIIYTIDVQTHHNINVEFHDRSIRPFHFTDHYNFTMG
ncbi:hypothetical protein HK097_005050, partial [Rhizophlyctis rosea]